MTFSSEPKFICRLLSSESGKLYSIFSKCVLGDSAYLIVTDVNLLQMQTRCYRDITSHRVRSHFDLHSFNCTPYRKVFQIKVVVRNNQVIDSTDQSSS